VTRYLVLGDPVVALGPAAVIPDGALIIEGPAITAAPVEPAHAYNARRLAGGERGAD
jgi:hypothetical protein